MKQLFFAVLMLAVFVASPSWAVPITVSLKVTSSVATPISYVENGFGRTSVGGRFIINISHVSGDTDGTPFAFLGLDVIEDWIAWCIDPYQVLGTGTTLTYTMEPVQSAMANPDNVTDYMDVLGRLYGSQSNPALYNTMHAWAMDGIFERNTGGIGPLGTFGFNANAYSLPSGESTPVVAYALLSKTHQDLLVMFERPETSVPEPGTLWLLGLGLIAGLPH